jgi:hypothetical protein
MRCWRIPREYHLIVGQLSLEKIGFSTKLHIIAAILDSILENKAFCAFVFEYRHLESTLGVQLLDFYGDDAECLINMWSWAKSSRSLGNIDFFSKRSVYVNYDWRSFDRQLKRDCNRFSGLHPSIFLLVFVKGCLFI